MSVVPSSPDSVALLDRGFTMLEGDLQYLMSAFAQVLNRLGQGELARRLPWVKPAAEETGKTDPAKEAPSHRMVGQALSIAFQLLNIVEERVAAQTRRLREKEKGAEAEPGCWPDHLRQLKSLRLSEAELAAALRDVCVEPVLTAHPTEAKRESVRELHLEIYTLMNKHENAAYTEREQQRMLTQMQTLLENLWRTGEIHVTRPTIEAELQNALHYLREVLPEALMRAHVHLREAWISAGYSAAMVDELPPLMRFGSWIGGDRDGHPFVTAEVTQMALRELRRNALRVHRRALEQLAQQVPLSPWFQKTPAVLEVLLRRLKASLEMEEALLADILKRNPEEPWRAAAYLMRAKLQLEIEQPGHRAGYARVEDLAVDIQSFESALLAVGAHSLAQDQLVPFRRRLRAFGFHSAALDVRQNSAFHEKALAQLLAGAGVLESGRKWTDYSLKEKRTLLDRELLSPRPFLATGMSAGTEADTVLACYRVLAEHLQQHGARGLGSLIVSMTRSVEDLLTVYLLAREAGLMQWAEGGLVCPLAVTPLFETMADLEAGPGIVEDFMNHPVTARSLRVAAGALQPTFQVMVGYSDSNKDCGILASQWALHQAQKRLAKTIQGHGVRAVFFHGRGGTVGRGAGPTHWFMEALPHGSLAGMMRMTEQGETIAQKYAHLGSAVYHLELLMASAAAATVRHRHGEVVRHELHLILDEVAEWSRQAYRGLLELPDFMRFYRQATPIDALENARIGSRPTRRTGQASLDDLRAIPWVFSWTQARFYLPGWFGAGSALAKLRAEQPARYAELKAGLQHWSFLRYVLTNIESSIVSVNVELMQLYGSLVEEADLSARFMGVISAEYARTVEILEDLFDGPFSVRRPRLAYTLAMREQPLRVLHEQQVSLLREWRGHQAAGEMEAAEAMIPDLLISINAVASGLRTTG
jgi:phosphoenolpyruvate carboxylase